MAINTKSIRTKLLAARRGHRARGGGRLRALRPPSRAAALIRDQIVKRGRYMASNLAFNAKYGVLTEDKPLLMQFLEGATAPGGRGRALRRGGRHDPRREGRGPGPDRQGDPRPARRAPGARSRSERP